MILPIAPFRNSKFTSYAHPHVTPSCLWAGVSTKCFARQERFTWAIPVYRITRRFTASGRDFGMGTTPPEGAHRLCCRRTLQGTEDTPIQWGLPPSHWGSAPAETPLGRGSLRHCGGEPPGELGGCDGEPGVSVAAAGTMHPPGAPFDAKTEAMTPAGGAGGRLRRPPLSSMERPRRYVPRGESPLPRSW